MLLMVDFEKAFDLLEWDYLKLVLEAANFGDDVLQWPIILYSECKSCVSFLLFLKLVCLVGKEIV